MDSQDQVQEKSDESKPDDKPKEKQPPSKVNQLDQFQDHENKSVDQQPAQLSYEPKVQEPVVKDDEEAQEAINPSAQKQSFEHDKQILNKSKALQSDMSKPVAQTISNSDNGLDSSHQLMPPKKLPDDKPIQPNEHIQSIPDEQNNGQSQKAQNTENQAPRTSLNGESTDNDNENENDQTFIYEPNQQKGPEDTTIVEEKHHKKQTHNDDVVRQTSQQLPNQIKEESKQHSPQKLNQTNEPILNIQIKSTIINQNDQNQFTIQQQKVQNIQNQHSNQTTPSQSQQIKNVPQSQMQQPVQPGHMPQQPIQQMNIPAQSQAQQSQSQPANLGQMMMQPNIQQHQQVLIESQPNQIQTNVSAQEGEDIEVDQDESEEEEIQQQFVDESPSGRFKRFDEELGRGAYKTVYRGVDHDTGREVAWSIISLGRLPKAERPRIKSEVTLIKQLNNPNIINFISAWICKEKDQIHFITEMITGGSLRQYLKRMVKPKLKVIKNWCIEILKGLNYLHTYQINGVTTPIIHRDIKCDNVFINSNSGEIKIGDLGLSTTMKNSYTSSVLGTPEFMAPELYEECYGTEVDIYAFGMALLEMITMEAPYKECQNPAQIYRKVVNRDYPQSLFRIQDDQVREFIMRCIDDRSKRPSAFQLLNSEFMMDSKSKNNSIPCAISEVPKARVPKKKLVLKNNMEGIPEEEENINDEMDIKDQNQGQVVQSNTGMSTANLQAHQEEPMIQVQQVQQNQQHLQKQIQNSIVKQTIQLQAQQVQPQLQQPQQLQKTKSEIEKDNKQNSQENQISESQVTLSIHQPQNMPQDASNQTLPPQIPDSSDHPNSDGKVEIQDIVDKALAQDHYRSVKSDPENLYVSQEKDQENDFLNQTTELFDKLNDIKEKQQSVNADNNQADSGKGKQSGKQSPENKSPGLKNRQAQPQDQSQFFVEGAQNTLDQQAATNLDENLQKNQQRDKVSSSQHSQAKRSTSDHDKNFFEKKSSRKNTDVQDTKPSQKEEQKIQAAKGTNQEKQDAQKPSGQTNMILNDLKKEIQEEDRKKLQLEKEALKQSMSKITEKVHPQQKLTAKQEPHQDKSTGAQQKGDSIPCKKEQKPSESNKVSHKIEETKEPKDAKIQSQKAKEKHGRKPGEDPQAIQNPQDVKHTKQKNDIDRKVKNFKEDEFEGQGKSIAAGGKISSSNNLIQSLNPQHNKDKPEGKNVLTPTGTKKTEVPNQVNQSKGHKRESEDVAKAKQHEAQKKQQIQNSKETEVKKRPETSVHLVNQQKQAPQESKKETLKQKPAAVQTQQSVDHKTKEKLSASNVNIDKSPDWVHVDQNRKKGKVSADREAEIPVTEAKKLDKPVHSDKPPSLKQIPSNVHPDLILSQKIQQTQGQGAHSLSKKADERKTQDSHVIHKETEKIQMKFEVLDNEVSFDYNLRKDTPEVVAREFVNEMKFENPTDSQDYFITFKDKIVKQLEKYHANKGLQKSKPPKKQTQSEVQQVVQQSPQQQIQTQVNLQESDQKSGHQQKKESSQHPQKIPVNPQHGKSNPQHHSNQANAVTPGTGATGYQVPEYHTEEFLKKRDEFKGIYKGMNTSIKKFFNAMNNEGMDIDKVLDVMDYVDEGDRAYKKNFIQSLQNVHRNFLNKEKQPMNKQASGEGGLSQSIIKTNQAQEKKQSVQNQSANVLSQSHQQTNPKSMTKSNPANLLSQSQNVTKQQEKASEKAQQDNPKTVDSKPSKLKDQQSANTQHQTLAKQQIQKKPQKEVSSKKTGEIVDVQKTINNIKAAYQKCRDIDSNQNMIHPSESDPIEVDGIYGEQTQIEIKKIQEKLSIEQDGLMNSSLIGKMEDLLKRLNFKNEQKIDLIKKQQKQSQQQQQQTNQQALNNNQIIEQKNQAQKEPNQEKKQNKISSEQTVGAKKTEIEHDEYVEQQVKVKIKADVVEQIEEEEKQAEQPSQDKETSENNGVYNFAQVRITEVAEKEEQGSSGTNPLSKKDQQFQQEYDADLDQTQITMNSKEERDGGDTSSEATNITQHSIQQQQNQRVQTNAIQPNNQQQEKIILPKEDQHSPQNGSQNFQGNIQP